METRVVVMKTLLSLVLLAGLLGLALSAFLVLGDLQTHQDDWDGFALAIGVVLAIGVGLVAGPAAAALSTYRRHRTVSLVLAATTGILVSVLSLYAAQLTEWAWIGLACGVLLVATTVPQTSPSR